MDFREGEEDDDEENFSIEIDDNHSNSPSPNINDIHKKLRNGKGKKKKKNLVRRLKENTLNHMQSASTHGLPHVVQEKSMVWKSLWFILIIGSLGLAVYLVVLGVLDYLEFNVTTEVRLEDVKELEFPSILICNKIKYDQKNQRKSLDRSLENASLAIKDMLMFCTFDEDPCYDYDFEYVLNEKYGPCFMFNSDIKFKPNTYQKKKVKVARKIGTGLKVTLFIGLHKDIDKKMGDQDEREVFISINNKNPFGSFGKIVASAGYRTDILLKRSDFFKYPKPYSNCDFQEDNIDKLSQKSEAYRYVVKANYSYSQRICQVFCKNRLVASKCNCTVILSSLKIPNLASCGTREEMKCFNENKNKYDDKCNEMCPLECNRIKYENFVEKSNYHLNPNLSMYYKNLFRKYKSMTLNESLTYKPESDMVFLKIFYDSLSFMKYKEAPTISGISLLSGVGGTLGLFMGMSLLSIAEFFEILFKALQTIYTEKMNKRRRKRDNMTIVKL